MIYVSSNHCNINKLNAIFTNWRDIGQIRRDIGQIRRDICNYLWVWHNHVMWRCGGWSGWWRWRTGVHGAVLELNGQIWTQKGSDLPQMGHNIRTFFRSDFSTQNVLKSDLKKFRFCSIWSICNQCWESNLTSMHIGLNVAYLHDQSQCKCVRFDRTKADVAEFHILNGYIT